MGGLTVKVQKKHIDFVVLHISSMLLCSNVCWYRNATAQKNVGILCQLYFRFFTPNNILYELSVPLYFETDIDWQPSEYEREIPVHYIARFSFLPPSLPLIRQHQLVKKNYNKRLRSLRPWIIPNETVINLSTFRLCSFIAAGCLKPKKACLMSSSFVDGSVRVWGASAFSLNTIFISCFMVKLNSNRKLPFHCEDENYFCSRISSHK